MQGHPGASKMLKISRSRYYAPTLHINFTTTSVTIRCASEPTLVLTRNSNVHESKSTIRAMDPKTIRRLLAHPDHFRRFSRHLFAVQLRQSSTSAVAHALLRSFAQHAFVPNHIQTDKASAFTSQLLNEIKNESGFKINHATLTHAQIIGMFERNDQEFRKILKSFLCSFRETSLGSLRQPRHHGPQNDVPPITEMDAN